MSRHPHRFVSLLAAGLLAALTTSSTALAQDRTTSDRARMELSFDHGFALPVAGMSAENQQWYSGGLAFAGDLRLYAPNGLGAVVRTSYEGVFSAGLFSLDVGAAYRGDLVAGTIGGIQLVASAGASASYGSLLGTAYYSYLGPFAVGSAPVALGGLWGSVHLDFWHRNWFMGVGVIARAQWAEGYDDTLVTLTPTLRFGGDWGL